MFINLHSTLSTSIRVTLSLEYENFEKKGVEEIWNGTSWVENPWQTITYHLISFDVTITDIIYETICEDDTY